MTRQDRITAARHKVEVALAKLDATMDSKLVDMVLDHASTTPAFVEHVDTGIGLVASRVLDQTRHTPAVLILDRSKGAKSATNTIDHVSVALSIENLAARMEYAREHGLS